MNSVGLETKNHFAGEGQQQFRIQSEKPTNRYAEIPTLPLVEEKAPLLKYMSR
jgi:hypothetical protein